MSDIPRKRWRGFGKMYDVQTKTWRAWYVDKDGRRRWMDTRELVDKAHED